MSEIHEDEERVQIRTLNAAGLEIFRNYYDRGDDKSGLRISEPPVSILEDDRYTDVLPFKAVLPVGSPNNKIDLGRRVLTAITPERLPSVLWERGLWAWLQLFYTDDTLPPDESGRRWLLSSECYDVYRDGKPHNLCYRHRIWSPTYFVYRFGMLARSILTESLPQMGDPMESITGRNVITAPVLKAADLLYFDTAKNDLVTGAKRVNKGKKRSPETPRAGGFRDFVDIVSQVTFTHAIDRMSVEQIIDMLPRVEFEPFIAHAKRRLELGDLPPDFPKYHTSVVRVPA